MTRILGIDPGTQRTGWGVVSVEEGVLRRVASGVVALKRGDELASRLVTLDEGLGELISRHRPAVAAVEDVFYAKHAQSALKLGHARGVCLLAAAKAGLEIHSYPPAMVKKALSGHGRASKAQVARLVMMLLRLGDEPKQDEADALSVAICHAARVMRRI